MSSRKSAALLYFNITEDNYYVCNIETNGVKCNVKLTAKTGKEYLGSRAPTRTNNLKRHLKRFHLEIYDAVNEIDKVTLMQKQKIGEDKPKVQRLVKKYYKARKIAVSMTEQIFKNSIIAMIVKSGISLDFFSSEPFLDLNGEMAKILGVSLEMHNIKEMLISEANDQRTDLKNILKGKFMFLKIDACTCERTIYYAVNVQFLSGNHETNVKTLSIKEKKTHYNNNFIHELVEQVIEEFEINKKQILVVVFDYVSNLVEPVDKSVDKWTEREVPDDLEYNVDEKDETHELDDVFETDIIKVADFLNVNHMQCAVQTLQLAINDGLKEKYISNILERIRNIARALRAPMVDSVLKCGTGKSVILDQVNRWSTTYLMIERLLELKPVLEDMINPNGAMTEHQWEEVAELERTLKLPFLAIKSLQEVSVTPGSFFKEWKNLEYKLGQLGGVFANSLKLSMEFKERSLMDNDVFLSAIFVDSKYRILLNDEQLLRAREALFKIALQMRNIEETSDNVTIKVEPFSDSGSDESDFEKRLDIEEQTKRRRKELSSDCGMKSLSPLARFKARFSKALNKIEKIDRTSKLSVKDAVSMYPKIVKDVAWVLTALPTTQMTTERLFSGLQFIKSEQCIAMNADLMEAIVFLRTNST